MNFAPDSSSSLIARVQRRDSDAWDQLARLYGPTVYSWARKCGLQDQDAADVTQEVFASVSRRIPDFRHNKPGSTFRGWLWTITRNAVRLFYRQQERRPVATGGTDALDRWQQIPAVLDQESLPDAQNTQSVLVRRALELIRDECDLRTWHAFQRLAVDEVPVKEIADELGMSSGAVRQAKYRVLCRLREMLDGE